MPELTVLEKQLQEYAPEIFVIHMMMKDTAQGGGGETKLRILIDALVRYSQTGATGMVMVDFSKGRITNIDAKIKLLQGSSLTNVIDK